MYWSVVWCSGGHSWKCYKTLTFCSLLTRSTIPCACHAKRHLNFKKWSENGVFCTFWLRNVLRATTACTFSTSEPPKMVRTWCVLYILLANVLRATTACTFSRSQLPKVVREWCVLYILTSKCASRHNGVQLFISHPAKWLRTRHFSEPTFRPSGAPNHWKNTVFRDFPTFSRICIFFLLIFLFSLPLPCSAFHLSILSEVWLLNFLRIVTMDHSHPFPTFSTGISQVTVAPFFQSAANVEAHHQGRPKLRDDGEEGRAANSSPKMWRLVFWKSEACCWSIKNMS